MSQENVEIVRAIFEAYAREGIGGGVEFMDPEIVWNAADEAPQQGVDAAVAYMERWETEWDDLTTTPEEFIDAGDRVFVAVRFSGRGKSSGIEVDALLYEIYSLRDGKLVRMDEFTDRSQALEAAELSK
jgi:hypothetical protein